MTPETDHLENGLGTAAEMSHPTLWAFARTLERERDEARDAAKKAKAYKRVLKETNAQLKRERDALIASLKFHAELNKGLAEQYSKENKICANNAAEIIASQANENIILTQQRDRLAVALRRVRDGYGGQITDPDCGCDDCVYLRPIDAALQSLNQINE